MAYVDEEQTYERTVAPLLGIDTASAPTQLAPGKWRSLKNGYQTKIGANAKRPGTVPVTTTPLAGSAERLTVYRTATSEKILASSGTTLYKYAAGAWTALTGTLTSANVYDVDFTDGSSLSRKIITDGGKLKAYRDDTETVYEITPAADDASPAPPNALNTVNGKGLKYCFAYSGHIFVSDGSDTWWYLKRYTIDYLPSVQFERWVKENDYMNGPGVAFDNVCLLPMRRGWGILVGSTFDDFQGNMFLNTVNGVIAPRSISKVTYPDGSQTVIYLSDDGVYEVYDTGFLDTGSRRYSTRSLMQNKIDFDAIGLTETEKKAAVGYFDSKLNLYMLKVNKGSQRLLYAFDTRNREWYPWDNIKASSFVRSGELYYTGETGHLHKFDASLASDWNESTKTTGTPIDWDCISDTFMMEDNGYSSYLDYLVMMTKQYTSKSSMDVSMRSFNTTVELEKALKNEIMIWGLGEWGNAAWYNVDLTEFVGKPKRIVFKQKSPFFQLRLRNNRDELVELYQYKLIGRTSGG